MMGNDNTDLKWDELLRRKEIHLVIFSFLGILGTIVMASVRWYMNEGPTSLASSDDRDEVYLSDVDRLPDVVALIYICQFFITFTTIVAVMLLLQRCWLLVEDKRRIWSNIDQFDIDIAPQEQQWEMRRLFAASYTLFGSTLKWQAIAELVIHVPHPIIFLNPDKYNSGMFKLLELWIFLRIYLVFRCVYIFSSCYRMRGAVINSSKELQRKNFRIREGIVAKLLFYNHPGGVTLMLTSMIILMSGFWMFILERNQQPSAFGSLENCFWFVWVTWSTCGYGDLLPKTATGRLVVVFTGFSNLAILSLFGAVVTNLFAQSREEKYVGQYLAVKSALTEYRDAAASLVQISWRAKNGHVFTDKSKSHYISASVAIYGAKKRFRRARWSLKVNQSSVDDPVVDRVVDDISIGIASVERELGEHVQRLVRARRATSRRIDQLLNQLERSR